MKHTHILITIVVVACSQPTAVNGPSIVTDRPQATQLAATKELPVLPAVPPAALLPAGPLTLVALGDSLTQGDGDDSGRGYPGRLLEMVSTTRPGSTITNLGQSGWNSDALINGDQGLESQLTRASAILQTASSQGRGAVALLWIGSNDLWYLYEYGEGTNENDSLDAEHFALNIDTMLRQLRGTDAQVIVALVDDQSLRPVALKGEAFTQITQDELDRMSVQAARYNEIISEKAAQYGAYTVDFYHTDIFTNPATLYDDGNHPNQAGYDLIAQKWYEALSLIP